jgi:flagellar biosynthetic protein FlhB
MLLPMVVRNFMHTAENLMGEVSGTIANPDPERAMTVLSGGLRQAAFDIAPLVLGILVVGVGSAAAQGGLHVATKLFKPDFKKLNLFKGVKRTFGTHALWEGVKALVKTGVLAAVMYYSLRDLVPRLADAGGLPLMSVVDMVTGTALSLARTAAATGLVMAAADYAVAYRRTSKQMKMSKQEVKEEHKRQDGDPQVKANIRQRQMAMSRQRMMSDLAKADVVVVNPTHVAVALRYDPSTGAPRVVAKGVGMVAAKIREVAADKRIPMVQDVVLARALHKACTLGQEIPPEFFGAVARVLAFVMTLKARGSAAGTHRNPATL